MLSSKDLKDKNYGIFLGMPAYGGMITASTTSSLLDLQNWCKDHNINFYHHFLVNESLITRARNEIVASMLDFNLFNITHLLFIDSDIGFTTKNIERLICSEKDIACGIYPSKGIYWHLVKDTIIKNPDIGIDELMHKSMHYNMNFFDRNNVKLQNGFCLVKDAATGFMLIKKDVFQIMQKKYPERKYNPKKNSNPNLKTNNLYDFFPVGIYDKNENHYLSEDYFFCRLWQECGGEIWADTQMPLTHNGTFQFKGHVGSIFKNS